MGRSVQIPAGDSPALSTRSKLKKTGLNATQSLNGNKKGENEPVAKKSAKKQDESETKNGQTPEQKEEIDQPIEESEMKCDTKPDESCDGNQNSLNDTAETIVDEEMKEEEPAVKVEVIKEGESKDHQPKTVSATTKALQKLQENRNGTVFNKRKPRLPLCIRRRKLNQRLNKLLVPKSSLIFLHELKPGCSITVQEQSGSDHPVFLAQVEFENKVVAVGQGVSKLKAKHAAAENAIKALVAERLSQKACKVEESKDEKVTTLMEEQSPSNEVELMDTWNEMSIAGLASFAMYKMFSEWQSQGTELPLLPFLPKKKSIQQSHLIKTVPTKKELPPNAEKLHPSFLLNTMRPGLASIELERYSKEKVSVVTVGYEIDGKMYKGSGSNKKEARKRAAQTALSEIYGLKYED